MLLFPKGPIFCRHNSHHSKQNITPPKTPSHWLCLLTGSLLEVPAGLEEPCLAPFPILQTFLRLMETCPRLLSHHPKYYEYEYINGQRGKKKDRDRKRVTETKTETERDRETESGGKGDKCQNCFIQTLLLYSTKATCTTCKHAPIKVNKSTNLTSL